MTSPLDRVRDSINTAGKEIWQQHGAELADLQAQIDEVTRRQQDNDKSWDDLVNHARLVVQEATRQHDAKSTQLQEKKQELEAELNKLRAKYSDASPAPAQPTPPANPPASPPYPPQPTRFVASNPDEEVPVYDSQGALLHAGKPVSEGLANPKWVAHVRSDDRTRVVKFVERPRTKTVGFKNPLRRSH